MWINNFETEHHKNGLFFYEPLKTKAPQSRCQPYCCYLKTVIFYQFPRKIIDGHYAEWDRTETNWDLLGERWTSEDIGWSALAPLVIYNNKVYRLTGGTVVRHKGFWHMRWFGRELREGDIEYDFSQKILQAGEKIL